MGRKLLYKDEFFVIGKTDEGKMSEAGIWVRELWRRTIPEFDEVIEAANGNILGCWGITRDYNGENNIWSGGGRYMAGCEVDKSVEAPVGWEKWYVPSQTYIVVETIVVNYFDEFMKVMNDESVKVIGAVQERYPDQNDPERLEMLFPVEKGM